MVLLWLASALVVAMTGRAYASEGRIAFVGGPLNDLAGYKIATMWADGTHAHALVSVIPSQTVLASPTWSYNRLWIAYTADPNKNFSSTTPSQIRVVRWDGPRDHAISFTPPWPDWEPKDPTAMAWSPSGRYLIVAESEEHLSREWLIMIDLRGGVARPLLQAGGGGKVGHNEISSLSFSTDGHYLAVGEVRRDSQGTLQPVLNRLIDVSTARTVRTYPSNVYGIDIAPDGKHLSFLESRVSPVYLRRADMNFQGRMTVLKFGSGSTTGWWVNRMDYLAYTKWSLDGARIGVTALHFEGTDDEPSAVPYVVHVRPNGSGFTIPLLGTGSWAGAFDW